MRRQRSAQVMPASGSGTAADRSATLGLAAAQVHSPRVRLLLVVLLAACGAASSPATPRPSTGGIAGLVRDHDSGAPVATAEIRVRAMGQFQPVSTQSSDHGAFDIQKLRPGRYTLSALFAGQPIEVSNIEVRAGEMTMVDVTFTLGRPEPIQYDHAKKGEEIERYRPKALAAEGLSRIEGTVNDTMTRQRVPGAVVTAMQGNDVASTQQTVSDDEGRYHFERVAPGSYAVSAYYSIGGRAQIEVRRSGIDVAGAEAVIVPLWIEMQR
ncbi:MAG TPA: carboxypeptidase-like regulatory domain-containing protein [Kofleriaceae bacterium]|nr:carboxypeptidase-like regulatory domain-containing protein [Kofleriaceae bacterium]